MLASSTAESLGSRWLSSVQGTSACLWFLVDAEAQPKPSKALFDCEPLRRTRSR